MRLIADVTLLVPCVLGAIFRIEVPPSASTSDLGERRSWNEKSRPRSSKRMREPDQIVAVCSPPVQEHNGGSPLFAVPHAAEAHHIEPAPVRGSAIRATGRVSTRCTVTLIGPGLTS